MRKHLSEYLGKTEDQVRKVYLSKSAPEQTADLIRISQMQRFNPNTGQPLVKGPTDLYMRVAIKSLEKVGKEHADSLEKLHR